MFKSLFFIAIVGICAGILQFLPIKYKLYNMKTKKYTKQGNWFRILLAVIVLSGVAMGCINGCTEIKSQKEQIEKDKNDSIWRQDVNKQLADCGEAKKSAKENGLVWDSFRKEYKPATSVINNYNNVSNEPELSAMQLKSAIDSVLNYHPERKCFYYYLTPSTNSGKIQVQLKLALRKKGYEYSGGGPWLSNTKSPLSFIDDGDGCIGIILDRF